jgi:hypothetical protein
LYELLLLLECFTTSQQMWFVSKYAEFLLSAVSRRIVSHSPAYVAYSDGQCVITC